MKKKLFMILALVMATMTASAEAGYDLVGKCENGSITFKVNGSIRTSATEGETVTVEVNPSQGWTGGFVSGRWYAAVAGGKAVSPTEDIDMLKDFEPAPVEGKENTYTFTMERANVEITAEMRKDFSNPDIVVYAIADVPYTGWEVSPIAIVKDGEKVLKEGVDYTVTCTNYVEIGPSVATVTGIGKYSGEVTRLFYIVVNKINLGNALIVANNYYNSILGDYPDIAAVLKTAIDAAEGVKADEEASQEAVDKTTEDLKDANATAEAAVRDAQHTGIGHTPALSKEKGVWYDMLGRQVAKPKKGPYIFKGKKYSY